MFFEGREGVGTEIRVGRPEVDKVQMDVSDADAGEGDGFRSWTNPIARLGKTHL